MSNTDLGELHIVPKTSPRQPSEPMPVTTTMDQVMANQYCLDSEAASISTEGAQPSSLTATKPSALATTKYRQATQWQIIRIQVSSCWERRGEGGGGFERMKPRTCSNSIGKNNLP